MTTYTFGEYLRMLRGPLSQQALADYLGFDQRTISALENGHDLPSMRIMRALAAYFPDRAQEIALIAITAPGVDHAKPRRPRHAAE